MIEQEKMLGILKKGLLFRNMEDDEIMEALETMGSHRSVYPKRTLVMRDGDAMTQVGIILSGNLHLFHIDANGNSNLMENLGEGEPIGLLNAVGEYPAYLSGNHSRDRDLVFECQSAAAEECAYSPGTDSFSAKPDGRGRTAGASSDPKAGGQHPAFDERPPARLSVRSVP